MRNSDFIFGATCPSSSGEPIGRVHEPVTGGSCGDGAARRRLRWCPGPARSSHAGDAAPLRPTRHRADFILAAGNAQRTSRQPTRHNPGPARLRIHTRNSLIPFRPIVPPGEKFLRLSVSALTRPFALDQRISRSGLSEKLWIQCGYRRKK